MTGQMCESDNGFLALAQDRPLTARGFTLIELLIAMVLLALLIAIALNSMGRARDKVYVAAVQTDLRNLVTAQENFFAASDEVADGPRYSDSLEELDFQPSRGVEMQISEEGMGWTARARHVNRRTHRCAVFVGEVDPYWPAEDEGVIACGEAEDY
jgi:prepilin-type N-terminal cleavage/methylation domain-containing protein